MRFFVCERENIQLMVFHSDWNYFLCKTESLESLAQLFYHISRIWNGGSASRYFLRYTCRKHCSVQIYLLQVNSERRKNNNFPQTRRPPINISRQYWPRSPHLPCQTRPSWGGEERRDSVISWEYLPSTYPSSPGPELAGKGRIGRGIVIWLGYTLLPGPD